MKFIRREINTAALSCPEDIYKEILTLSLNLTIVTKIILVNNSKD